MKRMIQADQRRGFRHAISLNCGISQTGPERFCIFGQRGSSRNEGPELPAKTGADSPETPPAPKKVLLLCTSEIFIELLSQAVTFHFVLDFALQRFDKSRDGHENRDTLTPNHVDNLGRLQRIDKDYGARQKRRNECPQHLTKHMTQREQIEETQRMKDALIAEVFLDFTLERFDISEHVAVRDHHAARF